METVLRVTVVYLFIVFGLRILGKRELSELSPLELVVLLLVPELVSQSLVGEDFSLTNALVAVATLFLLVFLTSILTFMSKKAETLIEGEPTVLVHRGQFLLANMGEERITPGEIFSEMHQVGLEELSQVKWAILENDGKISIVAEDVEDRRRQLRPEEQEVR